MRAKLRIGVGLASAVTTLFLVAGGSAQAAFPNFSDCPRLGGGSTCVNIVSTGGALTIKGFAVPLKDSLEIRGAIDSTGTFVPPAGTTGFFGKPVQVPGGILGIDFPIPGNAVTATAELAGPPSAIRINVGTLGLRVPVKLRLTNPLIGPGCQIASNSNPVVFDQILGTTNPPAPNRPITGRRGTISFGPNYIAFLGNENVDNSFGVPGATGCGINLGLINALINLKLQLPSAGGNNEIRVINNAAIGGQE